VAISMVWLGAAVFTAASSGLRCACRGARVQRGRQRRDACASRSGSHRGCQVGTLAAVSWWLHARPGVPLFDEAQALMFRARWWAYFLPPVDHPWWGDHSVQVIGEAGVLPAIVELQLTPGFVALGLAAWGTRAAFTSGRAQERAAAGVALAIVTARDDRRRLRRWRSGCYRAAPVFRGWRGSGAPWRSA
jgi:hypothetical protein